MKQVRILVADDHEVVRSGVRAILERQRGWIVCGETSTGPQAVTVALELRPDVIVLDAHMPQLRGLDVTRRIRRAVPSARIVMIGDAADQDQIVKGALAAGARGYLSMTDAGHTLVEAVRAVLEGRTFVSGYVNANAEIETQPAGGVGRPAPLALRGREVLQLLAARSNGGATRRSEGRSTSRQRRRKRTAGG